LELIFELVFGFLLGLGGGLGFDLEDVDFGATGYPSSSRLPQLT
jgi:hypothetical protein